MAIPMTVERSLDQQGPAALTIFFAPSSKDSQSPAPTQSTTSSKKPSDHSPFERTHVIDMKHKESSRILEEFMRVVDGKQVEATESEKEEMTNLDEQRERSDSDRAQVRQVLLKQRREKAIIEQARQSVEIQKG
ncbi:MAG: hypothetical protein M1831_001472 [Alyxoria varia]|nr:MAG: hypothetical protein M1831_001472 [Alyxoria varia]